jgi:DNA-directed RNA polymerase subunit RPC12/RpoP
MPETRTFKCYDCQHEWTLPYGTGRPPECPACRSRNICRAEAERGPFGSGAGAGPRQRCRRGQAKP